MKAGRLAREIVLLAFCWLAWLVYAEDQWGPTWAFLRRWLAGD